MSKPVSQKASGSEKQAPASGPLTHSLTDPLDLSARRIEALHCWYASNVLNIRRTPEVERLWLEWLRAGYNGTDLRDVVKYIRKQISLGKRNEGALKLTNLFERSEDGFIKFDEDLALARARANLRTDKPLAPAPDEPPQTVGGTSSASPHLSPTIPSRGDFTSPGALKAVADLKKFKDGLK